MSSHSKPQLFVSRGLMNNVAVNVIGLIAVISLAGVVLGWSSVTTYGTALFVAGLAALLLAGVGALNVRWIELRPWYGVRQPAHHRARTGHRGVAADQYYSNLFALQMLYTGILAMMIGMALYLAGVEFNL